jgi:hypothetical protein
MYYPEKRIMCRHIMFAGKRRSALRTTISVFAVANPAGMSHEKNPSGFFAVGRVIRPGPEGMIHEKNKVLRQT